MVIYVDATAADLVKGSLADRVVNDAKSLFISLQLMEHRGPGQSTTGDLVGHWALGNVWDIHPWWQLPESVLILKYLSTHECGSLIPHYGCTHYLGISFGIIGKLL